MTKILKIPFDSGNPTGARGAAQAPEEIAKSFPELPKTEVKVKPSNFDKSMASIEKAALKEFRARNRICAIGGDHSITYGLVRAASKVHQNLTLIYFDAHLDCEDDFLPPSHEDIIRAIVNEKLVRPENIYIVGARKWWPKEEAFVKKHGIRVIPPNEMKNFDISSFVTENIYLSVDIDVFDPEVAPATNYCEKRGITFKEFEKFTEMLNFKGIVGYDVVEVTPALEKTKKTVALASDVIRFLL